MSWYNPRTWFKSKPKVIELPLEIVSNNTPSKRKKYDTKRVTKQMYDFILEAKMQQENHNDFYKESKEHPYETVNDLCDYINLSMGTNFGRTKISDVWLGKYNREGLPDGPVIEIPF